MRTAVAHQIDNRCKRLAERTVRLHLRLVKHTGARLRHQLCGDTVVQNIEVTGDIGLKRELMEQCFAKAVDGLDFKAARCFKRTGKQTTGHRDPGSIRMTPFDLEKLLSKIRIVHRHPGAEYLEDTGRHFSGRSFSEGQRQDAGRVGAIQQQPDNPARQDKGLPRPGVCTHPGGRTGSRCKILTLPREVGDLEAAHAGSSPPSAHSCARARWS